MKKLSLKEMFGRGQGGSFLPGEKDNKDGHRFPRPPRTVGSNEFPYTAPAGEIMSDDEIEDELQLEFKLGSTQPGGPAMSYGRSKNSGGGWGGGKSSKGWPGSGKSPSSNDEDPIERDSTKAVPIDWMQDNSDEDLEVFDNFYGIQEAIGIGARERATKEGGPVSTKQPWKDGIPGSEPNYTTEDDVDKEKETKELENEIGLSLESILFKMIKEYADTDYNRYAQSKKSKPEHDDLDFFEKMDTGHPFLMTSEEEFEKNQKTRKKKGQNETKKF